MGQWDKELVSLLPESVKIFASAGAGYDWACTDVLAEHGKLLPFESGPGKSLSMRNLTELYRNRILQWGTCIIRSCSGHGTFPLLFW